MKVYFSEGAISMIEAFYDEYEALYFRLYDDTGLWPAEEIIKAHYHESSHSMRNGLFTELQHIFSEKRIHWYSPLEWDDNNRLLVRTHGRYRIFVEYREEKDSRILHTIKIYRK